MTRSQHRLLAFVREFVARHGFSPSYDEMATHMGLNSKSGVSRLLNALADSGHVRWARQRKRSVEPVGIDPYSYDAMRSLSPGRLAIIRECAERLLEVEEITRSSVADLAADLGSGGRI